MEGQQELEKVSLLLTSKGIKRTIPLEKHDAKKLSQNFCREGQFSGFCSRTSGGGTAFCSSCLT